VTTEDEAGKGRKTQKLQTALDSIPVREMMFLAEFLLVCWFVELTPNPPACRWLTKVMSIEWFDALCDGGNDEFSVLELRNAHATAKTIPKGSAVKAKTATAIRKEFMLNKKKITEHALFDKRFDAARVAEEEERSQQQEKKRKREEEERRKSQKKHKRPAPGSDVLKVDELAPQEFPNCEVFVQNTKDRGFIAFNVMCNLTGGAIFSPFWDRETHS
jgi:hypothetical protein